MGSVVLAVTAPRHLRRHGPFRPQSHSGVVAVFVMPALMLNYLGQGAMLLVARLRGGRRGSAQSLLHARLRRISAAVDPACGRRHGDREPGGHFGSLFGHPAGRSSSVRAASQDLAHQRLDSRADLHSVRKDADGDGNFAGAHIPVLVQLAAAYGLAVTGAMLIDSVLIAVVLFHLWRWNRIWAGLLLAVFFTVDLAISCQCDQDPMAAGCRC